MKLSDNMITMILNVLRHLENGIEKSRWFIQRFCKHNDIKSDYRGRKCRVCQKVLSTEPDWGQLMGSGQKAAQAMREMKEIFKDNNQVEDESEDIGDVIFEEWRNKRRGSPAMIIAEDKVEEFMKQDNPEGTRKMKERYERISKNIVREG